jgi:hypothetical protein
VAQTLEQVVEQLRREPGRPIRTAVDGFMVEVRAVPDSPGERSAADVLSAIGPWAGETTEEILTILANARQSSGQRTVPEL